MRRWFFCATLIATMATGWRAQAEAPAPSPASDVARVFWSGIHALGLIFTNIGTPSGGADRGEIWSFDVATGERTRVGAGDGFSWPVQGTAVEPVLALRGRRAVRILPGAGEASPVGPEVVWRKLLGIAPEGSLIGFIADEPRARPAVVGRDGTLKLLPQPESEKDQRNSAVLLQENHAYADGRVLSVRRSERGGFDVYFRSGAEERNISDCGDDACGQPSLTPDGTRILYVVCRKASERRRPDSCLTGSPE